MRYAYFAAAIFMATINGYIAGHYLVEALETNKAMDWATMFVAALAVLVLVAVAPNTLRRNR